MKFMKFISILTVLCLALSACAAEKSLSEPQQPVAEPDVETSQADTGEITVTSIDELIEAIAPDTQIVLAPGVYSLSDAATYGAENTGNDYCFWYDVYDGYEFVINDIDNLTIRGSGMEETIIEAEPRFANVIRFVDCTNTDITDLTAGHTLLNEGCMSDVFRFENCSKITVQRDGLFGCGATGITTDFCNKLEILDCDIYNCSSSGVWFANSRNITVENCKFRNIGAEYDGTGLAALYIYDSNNIDFRNCNIQGNRLLWLISCFDSYGISLTNSGAADNYILEAAFNTVNSEFCLDNTEITGNDIYTWYSGSSNLIHDANSRELTETDLDQMYTAVIPEDTNYEPQPMREIHASTVDELISAIAPNTCIILDAPVYDLSQAAEYGGVGGMYYEWRDIFDGPALWITDVDNLTIMSGDGNKNAHTLSAVPRYADVLGFSRCSNICLIGFTAGHTTEPGYCAGGVLNFEECTNIYVNNCNLYGCGTIGIQTNHCRNLIASNCNIYECSYGGVSLSSTREIDFSGCSFWSLGGPRFSFYHCKEILIDGVQTENGYYN